VRPWRDRLFYIQVAGGFRPGGINIVPGLDPALAVYREDRITSYEIGTRLSFLRDRLQLDATLYRQDWRDMQYAAVSANGAFGLITNIGSARIDGAELGLHAMPVRDLDLRMQASWTNARLTADQQTALATASGRAGDRLPYVAPLAASATASRRWLLGGALTLTTGAQLRYVGRTHSEFSRSSADDRTMGGNATLDLSLALEGKAWTATLRFTNLTNGRGVVWAGSNAFLRDARALVAPRAGSLSVATRF
jgi:outer membrane receptor protein involved in Fe transport